MQTTPNNTNPIITAETALSNLVEHNFDSGELFTGTPSKKFIKGYTEPSLYTPEYDDKYIFPTMPLQDLVVWLRMNKEPVWLFGPTGAGKSSMTRQLSSLINYPVFELTGNNDMQFDDLCGHPVMTKKEGWSYQYGPLALAMRYGCVLLFNEMDTCQAGVLCGLNTILDGAPLCIPANGGELILPHPMFRLVVTANTNGNSDPTAMFQGTMKQNISLLDRFMFINVEYMDKQTELELLKEIVTGLPEPVLDKMIDMASEARSKFMKHGTGRGDAAGIELPFSTRSLIRWGQMTVEYEGLAAQGIQPIRHALYRAISYKGSLETQSTLDELLKRHFPSSLGERKGA